MNKDQYAFSFCSGSSVIKSSLLIFFLEGGIGRGGSTNYNTTSTY